MKHKILFFAELNISSNLASYLFVGHSPFSYDNKTMTDSVISELEEEFKLLTKNITFEDVLSKLSLK